MRSLVSLFLLLLLPGCGGFRGGIESVPYVGEQEPQETSSRRPTPHEITLPGLTARLSLNNTVRTYQYEVMLYLIPTYLNFWDEFQHRDAASLELSLELTALESGVTIDPLQLVLTVDGKEFRPTEVWVNNLDRERQALDAYVTARRQAPANKPPPFPSSSEWRDAVTAPVKLRPGEKSPRLLVMFPVPLPSPKSTLSLDLGPALGTTMFPGKPVIRFKSMRWSEGYS
jgi:hypothetical protein